MDDFVEVLECICHNIDSPLSQFEYMCLEYDEIVDRFVSTEANEYLLVNGAAIGSLPWIGGHTIEDKDTKPKS